MLSPDSGDVTVALLSQISQQLAAISNGSAAPVPSLVVTPASTSGDHLQAITCSPAYQKHSFEVSIELADENTLFTKSIAQELQLAYRRAGRALTSEQIIQTRVI